MQERNIDGQGLFEALKSCKTALHEVHAAVGSSERDQDGRLRGSKSGDEDPC
jgi:hypothetical protein